MNEWMKNWTEYWNKYWPICAIFQTFLRFSLWFFTFWFYLKLTFQNAFKMFLSHPLGKWCSYLAYTKQKSAKLFSEHAKIPKMKLLKRSKHLCLVIGKTAMILLTYVCCVRCCLLVNFWNFKKIWSQIIWSEQQQQHSSSFQSNPSAPQ